MAFVFYVSWISPLYIYFLLFHLSQPSGHPFQLNAASHPLDWLRYARGAGVKYNSSQGKPSVSLIPSVHWLLSVASV